VLSVECWGMVDGRFGILKFAATPLGLEIFSRVYPG
jgi:hypothetical protein